MIGIHSIPAEQYHASDAVSNSRLKWMERSPAHYKAKWIDKLIPEKQTEALTLGSLTHRYILEPDTVIDFAVKPKGMKFSTKEGMAWEAEHMNHTIITAEDHAHIKGMRASIMAHPVARKAVENCDKERSLFAEDDGLRLKARFDLLPRIKGWNSAFDLKTIQEADADSCAKACWEYGYYRQAAFYLKIARLLELELSSFVFIFVEKTPPYAVNVLEIDPMLLEFGNRIIARDLQLLRNCMESGEWPAYGHGIGTLIAPAWAQKQIEQTQKN